MDFQSGQLKYVQKDVIKTFIPNLLYLSKRRLELGLFNWLLTSIFTLYFLCSVEVEFPID